jgi:serine/threonine-protein kinase
MMAALHHPGVVDVYDVGESDAAGGGSVVYLVMAYVAGEPLSAHLARAGRLSVADTASIVAQAADALHAAHEVGIVHRDVKPANLLVQPDGTVVLVDFGVAHSVAATRLTAVNTVLGTALYMAPEQASGRPVSPATDIYALGAVAYHCLVGHPPFTGDNALHVALRHLQDEPEPLPDHVPAPIRAVVAQALAKDPASRFPSAAAFAAAARAAAAGTTVVASAAVGDHAAGGTLVDGPILRSPTAGTVMRGAAMGGAAMAAAAADPTAVAGPRSYAGAPAYAGAGAYAGTPTAPVGGPAPAASASRGRSRRRTAFALALIPLLLGLVALAAALGFGRDTGAQQTPGPGSSSTPSAAVTRARSAGATATAKPTAQPPRSTTASSVPTPRSSAPPTTTSAPRPSVTASASG